MENPRLKGVRVILYTSATNKLKRSKQILKTAIIYFVVAAFCIIFDKVYAVFGHGVYCASMSLMFLYPLIGGGVLFLLLWLFILNADDVKYYRFYYNCYNSGIAALTIGSILNGIFKIAGTSSAYVAVFIVCGYILSIIGFLGYLINLSRRQKAIIAINKDR